MICENCLKQHDGTYGSGRFCSVKCARGFSTKNKRTEINKQVSEKMKGRESTGKPFVSGYDPRRKLFSDEDRLKAIKKKEEIRLREYASLSFDELPLAEKRRLILSKQKGKCNNCKISEWCGLKLVLELHHINGNHEDNREENLEILCPNCHSLTENFRNKKRKL